MRNVTHGWPGIWLTALKPGASPEKLQFGRIHNSSEVALAHYTYSRLTDEQVTEEVVELLAEHIDGE